MDFDAFEDDLEVLELIAVGISRQIYLRADHFHDLPDLQFFQRFRFNFIVLFWYIGDSGYPVRRYFLTPMLNPQTQGEQLYNEAHIRTRNVIERTFGVWKRRFPILAYGCRLKQDTVLAVIIACAVLHNIARERGEEDPPLPAEINQHELQQLIEAGNIPEVPAAINGRERRGAGHEFRRSYITNFFNRQH